MACIVGTTCGSGWGILFLINKMTWNDSEEPLAYLITFRAYGTWLHGDERGSIDRHNNVYGAPKYESKEHWKDISHARLKQTPVKLDPRKRKVIERAIIETCEKRNWKLLAINIRTNHIHVVVAIGTKNPSLALNAFKSNSTRMMRELGCWQSDRSPWADKGSKRWLWTEKNIFDAVNYVLNGQGDDLPFFE